MLKVKLSVCLPVLFCGIEAARWYWDRPPAQVSLQYLPVGRPFPIPTGLEFPAIMFSMLAAAVFAFVGLFLSFIGLGQFESFWTNVYGRLEFPLLFLFVAGCWYLIGRWLDRRALVIAGKKSRTTLAWEFTPQPLVLAFGIFTWLSSLHMPMWGFNDVMDRALVRSWAVFLIGVPVLGLARRLLRLRQNEKPTGLESRARQPISNFRFFAIVLGVFAALLILGVLTAPKGSI